MFVLVLKYYQCILLYYLHQGNEVETRLNYGSPELIYSKRSISVHPQKKYNTRIQYKNLKKKTHIIVQIVVRPQKNNIKIQ